MIVTARPWVGGASRRRATAAWWSAPHERTRKCAWEMVCIDFIIISKLHHLNHNWWW